jgi:hypothetical protein
LFKFELVNEESQKEIARLVDDQNIVSFLFPQLKTKFLNLPCFNSHQNILSSKVELSESMTSEMYQSVEVFIKGFNTPQFSNIKAKIELSCNSDLQDMKFESERERSKVPFKMTKIIEWLLSSKSKVIAQIKAYHNDLEVQRFQLLQETNLEAIKNEEENKKKIEEFKSFIN